MATKINSGSTLRKLSDGSPCRWTKHLQQKGESVLLGLYSDRYFLDLVTVHHLLLNYFLITKASWYYDDSLTWLGKWGGLRGHSDQPAWQLRQNSASAHPIRLDSAEINSVDKLLAKQSEEKREGSLLLGRVWLHAAVEEKWSLLFVHLRLFR